MPYQPAASQPRPDTHRGWTDAAYRAQGVLQPEPREWRRIGVTPRSARRLLGAHITFTDACGLARRLSTADLDALTTPARPLQSTDVALVAQMADADLEGLRTWLTDTRLPLREIQHLAALAVTPSLAQRWLDRLPPLRRGVLLSDVLHVATISRGVPREHVNGWLSFALTHRVVYDCNPSPWGFLGGLTALFATAGLSPDEADDLVGGCRVDVPALTALAALRRDRSP